MSYIWYILFHIVEASSIGAITFIDWLSVIDLRKPLLAKRQPQKNRRPGYGVRYEWKRTNLSKFKAVQRWHPLKHSANLVFGEWKGQKISIRAVLRVTHSLSVQNKPWCQLLRKQSRDYGFVRDIPTESFDRKNIEISFCFSSLLDHDGST